MIKYKKILDSYKKVYDMSYRLGHEVVLITTHMGEWAIKKRYTRLGVRYHLLHKNLGGNTGKFHFHDHAMYKEVEHALKYIATHDVKRFYPNYEVPRLGA